MLIKQLNTDNHIIMNMIICLFHIFFCLDFLKNIYQKL
jgi:hypothetical protein